MTNKQVEPRKLMYLPELDGLRGAAIVCVMLFHAHVPFAQGGFIGVDAFFLLSGFLISALIVNEFDSCGSVNLRNFYMRRLLRLLPALLVLVVALCLASFLFLPGNLARSTYVDSLIALTYLSNWARAFSIHPPALLGHTWSLSIEEQFYLLWPALLLTLLRMRDSRLLAIRCALLLAAGSWLLRVILFSANATPERLYNGLDTRADALMLGCVLGIAFASGHLEKLRARCSKHLMPATLAAAALLIVISVGARWREGYMYLIGFAFVNCLTATLLIDAVLNEKSLLRPALRLSPLVWSGRISYGLYLWHYPIYLAMSQFGFEWQSIVTLGSLATFAVASLSYRLIELPILARKKNYK